MHFGPQDVLVALSLDFADSLRAGGVEASAIERGIKAARPEVTRIFVKAQSFEATAKILRSHSPSNDDRRSFAGAGGTLGDW